jgi:hypothetical protein
MKSTKPLRINELRKELKPLARACPLPVCNVDCPLASLREMLWTTRERWLAALSEEDLVYLATYHHICQQTSLELRRTR